MSRTLRTVTLGCKVNQYETELLREGLLRLGYRNAEPDEPAQLCLVNTCTVTAEGDRKSRKAIRQLHRENPLAEIIVMGCYATRDPQAVAALPGVVDVVTDKGRLPDLLARLGLADVPRGLSRFGREHRAYVKVQDGCHRKCAFCIIPSVRPTLSSRPVADILAEARQLVANGYRELVLTGIHLGHYGQGYSQDERASLAPAATPGLQRENGTFSAGPPHPDPLPEGEGERGLTGLVRRLAALEGEFRLRLSSLEAAEVTPELVGLLAGHPERICPHLHLSLQSGSDSVLARMGRRGDSRQTLQRCRAIGEALDLPALTCDIIVGFPGETDAEFQETCRVVEEIGFSKVHVFRFSPREGTPAATMSDQVPPSIKQQRAKILMGLADRLRQEYLGRLRGRTVQVLVEAPSPQRPELLRGSCDRYLAVELAGPATWVGRLMWAVVGPAVEDEQFALASVPTFC
jgi:threonylcarbamoyladenosine tRNA methylthiotransferase MtaB